MRIAARLLLGAWLATCAAPSSAQDQQAPAAPREDYALSPEELQSSRVYLWADKLSGTPGVDLEASGGVRLASRGVRIGCDLLRFNVQENSLTAPNKVYVEREGNELEGEDLRYDLDTNQGSLQTPNFRLSKTAQRKFASRGDAREAIFLSRNEVELKDARYTSCPLGSDEWYLRLQNLTVNDATQIGTARNVSVTFKGVPILYAPWLDFPLSDQRKSGFLTPTFGSSDSTGFDLSVPYYWNIAPNYDATFTPRLLTNRGLQLNAEARYLRRSNSGQFDVEYLPSDRAAKADRHFLSIAHSQRLPWGANGYLRLQDASDDDYFRDLSSFVALTSRTYLPREGGVSWGSTHWSFFGRALQYQTLQNPARTETIPYRLLPQLQLNGRYENVRGFDFDLLTEFTDFRHFRPSLTQPEGKRLIAYPSVSLPLQRSFGFLVPKIGVHFTRYNALSENSGGLSSQSRTVPIFSLDGGLYFDRDVRLRKREYRQTLEPRLFLVRIPFRDQSRIPNFSTSEADLSFAQLFSENRFIGGDRINDADQVTAALTTRFLDKDGGERLRAAIGQRYNFKDQRVGLTGTSLNDDRRVSDLLAGVSGRLSSRWWLDSALQYDTDLKRTRKDSFALRYSPALGKVVSFAYRMNRDPSNPFEQVDVSGLWPLSRNWYAVGRLNYSLREDELVEGLAGLEYNHACWSLRMYAHRFTTTELETSNSFFVQLELRGLTRLGNNPLDVLRRNIPGYITTSDIETGASQ
jgi:LPS-assembly protein